jgi:uncharacterized protein YjbI with pentapeptide repeats
LDRSDFSSANLTNAKCNGASFGHARFDAALLSTTDFEGANLGGASFKESNLREANLRAANLPGTQLEGIDFKNCDLTNTNFRASKLSGAQFGKAKLQRSAFQGADLSNASFDNAILDDTDLSDANLAEASLCSASLRNANLANAKFESALLYKTDFHESYVDRANFNKARGITKALNVHTVRFQNERDHVRYFDYVIIPILERVIGWEQIRFLRRLPLFAASYSVLIAIPFLYYLLDIFNRKIDVVRAWAQQEINHSATYFPSVQAILDHLHHEPIPSLSLMLLISTFLLSIGATIFALACPPRIREFSRDQWRDELRHSLIHYLPFSWRYRWLRILCVACYMVGGLGVTYVLANKLWNVFLFIIQNS